MTQAKSKTTTVPTPQTTRTTPKDKSNSPGPPVGLIVAPILLCVLIAALIFLWIKYKKREKRRKLRRQLRSDRPLLSTSAFPSEEPVPSPGSASESVVFTDEQSEKGQNLDPIEEREDNQESRVHSARPVQASRRVQQLVQEECAEPVENQGSPPSYYYHQYEQVEPYMSQVTNDDNNPYDEQTYPSESGGEPEEEEPQSFRERRFDSGYRSGYRTRPYYRDSYGKRLQNNVQEDSEDDSFAKKYVV